MGFMPRKGGPRHQFNMALASQMNQGGLHPSIGASGFPLSKFGPGGPSPLAGGQSGFVGSGSSFGGPGFGAPSNPHHPAQHGNHLMRLGRFQGTA